MKNFGLAFSFIVFQNFAYSQYDPLAKNSFHGREIQQTFEFWNVLNPTTSFHSSFRPYLSGTYSAAKDTLLPFNHYPFRNLFFSKTYNERPEARNWFNLQFHPILDLEPGYDLLTKRPVVSAIGGTHFKLNINNDFTFAASVFGGRVQLPFFIDSSINRQAVIPEYGQAYGNNKTGYNFFDYQGYVSYTTRNKAFNFQAGRDKHFIGEGYRSVLLSDFAPAYPYFKITTNIWRLQYSVWYTMMHDVTDAGKSQKKFRNKYGTFHYLSYNITKNINVGLFENIIWRGSDTNQARTFEVNYLNPVIFYRPQEYSLGSPDNSFLGMNASLILFKRIKLYGQVGLDEFFLKEVRARNGWWANKQAWQLGFRYMNAFEVKGLKVQLEYNQVRPYTYSHGLADQNYSHYGMPLAHPLGANFKEIQGFISLRRNNWELSAQTMYALIGKDSVTGNANMGQNIFKSYISRPYEYGHFTTQGDKHTVIQGHFKFSYFLIPQMNMRLELGYIQRSEKSEGGYRLHNPYLYLGFKTSFWNIYRDF